MDRIILYQPEVLYAVIGHYNNAVFPAQIVALVLALAALAYALWPRPEGGRVVAAILAAAWLWSGSAFLGAHYAAINWAGAYYEVGFAVQAALLLGFGAVRGSLRFAFDAGAAAWTGLGFVLFVLFVHPLIELAVGRTWAQLQLVGVSPDPTNLLTLGLLLMTTRRVPWLLLVVPVLWLLISGSWSWLLGTPERMILPLCCLIATATILWANRAKPRS